MWISRKKLRSMIEEEVSRHRRGMVDDIERGLYRKLSRDLKKIMDNKQAEGDTWERITAGVLEILITHNSQIYFREYTSGFTGMEGLVSLERDSPMYNALINIVQGEKFIDHVVTRINNKQLGGKKF